MTAQTSITNLQMMEGSAVQDELYIECVSEEGRFSPPETRRADRLSEFFSLGDFGGVVPQVGDTVIDPRVIFGDPTQPGDRLFGEVIARYFEPAPDRTTKPRIVLLLRDRSGRPEEADALGDRNIKAPIKPALHAEPDEQEESRPGMVARTKARAKSRRKSAKENDE